MSDGRLSAAEWRARAEAYSEAAEHLGQNWTDDPTERRQGEVVAARLRTNQEACLRMAEARERRDTKGEPMKPCPFNCEKTDLKIGGSSGTVYYVVCQRCGAQGPKAIRKADAEKFWNERRPAAKDS